MTGTGDDAWVGYTLLVVILLVYLSGLWVLLPLPLLWYGDFILTARYEINDHEHAKQPVKSPKTSPQTR
jgi:hypothetical protein